MKKILYLEADPINIQIFQNFMAMLPSNVDVTVLTKTESAEDALRNNQFDLFVSEIYPKEATNGLEIITNLRLGHYGEESKNIPAIALTAINLAGKKEECYAAGFGSYITKPINGKLLIEEIGRLLEPEDSGKKPILLFYLEPDSSEMAYLRVCISREFGKEILVWSTNSIGATGGFMKAKPSLIIANGPDTFNLIKAVRGGHYGDDLKNVPAIAYTAYALVGDRERYIKAGFNAYLAKPAHPQELTRVIKSLLPGLN